MTEKEGIIEHLGGSETLRIIARTEEVFGSREKASRWLREPNRALELQTPLSLLDTEEGARQVEDVLIRIEHGVFS